MKIVVIGGSGLIGSRLVNVLRKHGHEVESASPSSGINTITGEGLDEAMRDAEVVIDVSNSSSLEDTVALRFFETSTSNMLQAEGAAGVRNITLLSPLLVWTVCLNSIGVPGLKCASAEERHGTRRANGTRKEVPA